MRPGWRQLHHVSRQGVLQASPLPPSSLPLPRLANRLYLAGSDGLSFPEHLQRASHQDLDCYRLLPEHGNCLHQEIADVVNSTLSSKGAVLIRGLASLLPSNREFGRLAGCLGESFGYSGGFATREEDPEAPGEAWRQDSSLARCDGGL